MPPLIPIFRNKINALDDFSGAVKVRAILQTNGRKTRQAPRRQRGASISSPASRHFCATFFAVIVRMKAADSFAAVAVLRIATS